MHLDLPQESLNLIANLNAAKESFDDSHDSRFVALEFGQFFHCSAVVRELVLSAFSWNWQEKWQSNRNRCIPVSLSSASCLNALASYSETKSVADALEALSIISFRIPLLLPDDDDDDRHPKRSFTLFDCNPRGATDTNHHHCGLWNGMDCESLQDCFPRPLLERVVPQFAIHAIVAFLLH